MLLKEALQASNGKFTKLQKQSTANTREKLMKASKTCGRNRCNPGVIHAGVIYGDIHVLLKLTGNFKNFFNLPVDARFASFKTRDGENDSFQ